MNIQTMLMDKLLHISDFTGPNPSLGYAVARKSLTPNAWFVDAQQGSLSADGRDPRRPMKTLEPLIGATPRARSGDTIFVVGNVTEEITASNLLEDISIIGVGNRPRHADKARDYATYPTYRGISGVSWRQAASHGVTTPLLKIRGQGWHLENMLMVPPSDAAGIFLDRNALSDISEFDPSHLTVKGVRFVAGQSGIEDSGGCFNVRIEDCDFQQLTDGIKQLNSAVDVMTQWVLIDNRFELNTHAVRVSAKRWAVKGNIFGTFGSAPNIDLSFIAGNDALEVGNTLFLNQLAGTYNNTNYIEGAGNTDEWGGNGNVISGGWTAAQP